MSEDDTKLQRAERIDTTAILRPRSMGEALEFAKLLAASDFVPKTFRGKPGNVLAAVQMGAEVGLAPLQALQNIAVINGRPSIWGDAMLALVLAHPQCVDVAESMQGGVATCTVKRRGRSDVTRTFSESDARKADLWTKDGPWRQYPQRMLQMRARAFALRDAFPDALRGLQSAEESQDIEVRVTASDVVPAASSHDEGPYTPSIANGDLSSVSGQETDMVTVPTECGREREWTVPFGKNKGKRSSELSDKQLHWYRSRYERLSIDPEATDSAKCRDMRHLRAIEADLGKRLREESKSAQEAEEGRQTHYDARGELVDSETGEVLSDPDPSYLDPEPSQEQADPFAEPTA